MDYFQHLLMRSIIWVAVIMLAVLANGCNGCLEKERIALLQLKHSINIPNRIDRLPSWEEDDSMDCCHWERVECNSTTRRVIKLELGYTRDWRSSDDPWHLNASILLPFESLQSLNLSGNLLRSFVGNEGIGILPNFSNLEELDLSSNYALDILPSLNKFSNLKLLRLNDNNLNDSIYVKGIGILSNLTNLEELDLSWNNLGNGILPSLNKLSNLKFLRLAGINLNGSIYVKGIGILSNLTNLEELDLSENYLGNGILSSLNNFPNLKNLNLADTNLNGAIYVKEFDGLNNLKELDLSANAIVSISALNGSQEESRILKKLEVLDLSYNEALNNSVWSFLGGLSSIKTLDLTYNRGLHGGVHNKDLRNLSNIENLRMDRVVLDDVLPYIRVMTSIQVLSLTYCDSKRIPSIAGQEAKFTTKGISLIYRGIVLHLFSGINLSHNKLTGPIPREIGNLTNLKVLNLSHNNFIGTIPVTFSNFKGIESLDLSYNHLSGQIPSQLTELYSLEVFNLSYNNLSGRVPPRIKQFGTFDSSSYIGNALLCGEPLAKCNATDSPPLTPGAVVNDIEENYGFMDMNVFYMSFAGSYVTMVLAIMVILLINPYWRRAWFHLVEVSITSCYYFVVDNLVGRRRGFLWK